MAVAIAWRTSREGKTAVEGWRVSLAGNLALAALAWRPQRASHWPRFGVRIERTKVAANRALALQHDPTT